MTFELKRSTFCRKLAVLVLILAFSAAAGAGIAALVVRVSYPRRYDDIIAESCAEFGVEESLVYAVIRIESGFDPDARSELGALGLMQLMPETFEWLQTKLPPGDDRTIPAERLSEPETNIRYGVFFLSLLDEAFGDDTLTVAAYHAGQNRVSQWLREGVVPPTGCRAEDIPSQATRHYVSKVEHARGIYLRLYDV